jgi:hypothetical protein
MKPRKGRSCGRTRPRRFPVTPTMRHWPAPPPAGAPSNWPCPCVMAASIWARSPPASSRAGPSASPGTGCCKSPGRCCARQHWTR